MHCPEGKWIFYCTHLCFLLTVPILIFYYERIGIQGIKILLYTFFMEGHTSIEIGQRISFPCSISLTCPYLFWGTGDSPLRIEELLAQPRLRERRCERLLPWICECRQESETEWRAGWEGARMAHEIKGSAGWLQALRIVQQIMGIFINRR